MNLFVAFVLHLGPWSDTVFGPFQWNMILFWVVQRMGSDGLGKNNAMYATAKTASNLLLGCSE